jgi:hypothetical protein
MVQQATTNTTIVVVLEVEQCVLLQQYSGIVATIQRYYMIMFLNLQYFHLLYINSLTMTQLSSTILEI